MVIIKKRNSSTIPFGYVLSHGKLEPLESQLRELDEIKEKILNGTLSLRNASVALQKKTSRKISHVGLRKILGAKYSESKKIIKEKKIQIKEEKKRIIELKKNQIKEEKKITRGIKKKEQILKNKEKRRIYYQKNKKKIKEITSKWNKKNIDRLKKYRKDYYEKNREKILDYSKIYSHKNAVKIKKYYLTKDNDIKKKKSLW